MKPLQFEFELTHRETQRRDQVRATAWTESEAHQSIAAYYGDLYYVATSAHRIRAAREAWDETLQRHETDHCVIWSVFHDSYIVQPLPRIGALDLKYTGTRDECNAWIAQQR